MTQMANHFRFHRPHLHLHSPFGDDWFGRRAESFARFFGTPRYLLMQTVLVLCWIALNAMGTLRSDPYPFILLNLFLSMLAALFSTQAAYAAPLILLAQTRQADREKAHAEADARHREEIAKAQLELLAQNTDITEQVARLAAQIEMLTREIHGKLVQDQRA